MTGFLIVSFFAFLTNKGFFSHYLIIVFVLFFIYLLNLVEHIFLPFELTYGSDAFYYWKEIKSSISFSDCSSALAPFHVCINFINQSFSFYSIHPNVVLLSISFYALAVVILRSHLGAAGFIKGNAQEAIIFYLFLSNLIIFLMIIRGMKELYVIISYLFMYFAVVGFQEKKYIKFLVLFLISFFMADNLKPMGFLFVVLPFFLALSFLNARQRYFPIYLGAVIILLIIFNDLLFSALGRGQAHAVIVGASGQLEFSHVARFILGPGPYFSLHQLIYGNRFIASTVVGDWMIFLGSVYWYLFLSIFLLLILIRFRKFIKSLGTNLVFFYISAFLYITVYAVFYDGTGDTRHRAVMYFLIMIPAYVFIANNMKLASLFKFRSVDLNRSGFSRQS